MKKRLGVVPKGLEWITQNESVVSPAIQAAVDDQDSIEKDPEVARATFIMSQVYIDKIKAYAYWERVQIKDVMQQMCEEFFAGRKIRSIPSNKKNS